MRKVYRDFLKLQLGAGRLGWAVGVGAQYGLTKLSFALGRPLCGPILGTLVTNYTCNLRCRMCRMPDRDPALGRNAPRELSTEEMLGVIDGFAALGTRGIGITGGEPLLRRDLVPLVRRVRQRGMLAHLNSNGTLLDETAARGLCDAGLDSLNVSLDGAEETTHDRIRGVPGAFARAVSAIRMVGRVRRETGAPLRLKIVAVLSEENLPGTPDYLRLGRDLGADCVEFIPRQPFPEGPGGGAPADPDTRNRVDDVVRLLSRRAALPVPIENSPGMLALFGTSFRGEPSPLTCHAGYNSLAVDCYGRIFPCVPFVNWNRPVGELPGGGLKEFWYSREYDAARRRIAACRSCTLNCQAELNLLFNPRASLGRRRSRPREFSGEPGGVHHPERSLRGAAPRSAAPVRGAGPDR